MTHFVWYLEKEIRCNIETWSIERILNKKQFYGKNHAGNMHKYPKANSRLLLNFAI